ncbi:hypothetical protein [Chitinolyticbacter meiyuanensis]|uniref:hypothetical protein n=1 Tax=Chitinolyticbacter meiyuanensis TaxID=682798 RepID=UPI00165284B6|nr:hypothetical protein [Chitinolyticbacter meiyuanensis]
MNLATKLAAATVIATLGLTAFAADPTPAPTPAKQAPAKHKADKAKAEKTDAKAEAKK